MLGTSSLTCVGQELRIFKSERMSSKAARSSESLPSPTILGLPLIAEFTGVKKPLAAGSMSDACLSLPTSMWSALRRIVFRRRIVLVALMYAFAFAAGRWTVRRMPPCVIFFREMGSLPPSCFVI